MVNPQESCLTAEVTHTLWTALGRAKREAMLLFSLLARQWQRVFSGMVLLVGRPLVWRCTMGMSTFPTSILAMSAPNRVPAWQNAGKNLHRHYHQLPWRYRLRYERQSSRCRHIRNERERLCAAIRWSGDQNVPIARRA